MTLPRCLAAASALLLLGSPALSARVKVPGTSVSINVPAGFVPMPAEILALKYARGAQPPTQVYSTPGPSWAVNIAFALQKRALPAGDLSPVRLSLESGIEKLPGFRWVRHDVQNIAGRDWIVLQFWVDGLDTPIYNHLRVSREGNQTLLVTANVTKALYPKYAATLDAAMQSLK